MRQPVRRRHAVNMKTPARQRVNNCHAHVVIGSDDSSDERNGATDMVNKTRWAATVFTVLMMCTALGACSAARRPVWSTPSEVTTLVPAVATTATAKTEKATLAITYPVRGAGTFMTAPVGGPVVGTRGTLVRYRVVVERGINGVSPATFAEEVADVLGDPRSWIGTGRWRLQLVPAGARYDFTIYLVTPATRDVLCGQGYDYYTSCRIDNRVVLNVARWVHGVPHYGASLTAYREYMVNHEVGHRLYNGHELCPGPGKLAPVMEQQTLGLHGCLPNSWPIVKGRTYRGASGQYNDPVPRS
jgi:hypothetical protein